MKKILLGTTALVAATAVTAGVAKADLSVTGFTNYGVGTGNVEGNTKSMSQDGGKQKNGDFDIDNFGEVHFRGRTEMDNGMDLLWEVQMNQASGVVDEHYLDIGGDFGSFLIGAENLPNYKMHYSGGLYTGNAGLSSNTYSDFTGSPGGLSYFHSGFMNDTAPITNDAAQISYYTPRMNGVQVGVGYIPTSGGPSHTNEAKKALQFEDVLSVGANYVNDGMMMDGMSVALSGGYTTSNIGGNPGVVAVGTSVARTPNANLSTYQAGLNLGFGGLTLGVSYMGQNTGKDAGDSGAPVLKAGDTKNVFFGATYATGPHTVGLTSVLANAEEKSSVKGDTAGKAVMLAHDYAMGGGVTLTTAVTFLDVGDEDPASNESADGTAGMMLINASF